MEKRRGNAGRNKRRVQLMLRPAEIRALAVVRTRYGMTHDAKAVRECLRRVRAMDGKTAREALESIARAAQLTPGVAAGTVRWSQWIFPEDERLIRSLMDVRGLGSMAAAVRYAIVAEATLGSRL